MAILEQLTGPKEIWMKENSKGENEIRLMTGSQQERVIVGRTAA
jgi:hypothetical protein